MPTKPPFPTFARPTNAQKKRMSPTSFAIPGRKAYVMRTKKEAHDSLILLNMVGKPGDKAKVQAAIFKKFPSLKPKTK